MKRERDVSCSSSKWLKTFPLSVWEVIMPQWHVCVAFVARKRSFCISHKFVVTKIGCSDVSSICQDSLYTDIKLGSIYIPVLSPSVILSVFAPLVGGKQSGDSSNCYTHCISRVKHAPPTSHLPLKVWTFSGKVWRELQDCACLDVKSFIIYETTVILSRIILLCCLYFQFHYKI